MDGQPVQIVLLLAIPAADTTGAHMKVFAKLARKLMHEEFREKLTGASDAAAVERTLREELGLDSANPACILSPCPPPPPPSPAADRARPKQRGGRGSF